MAAVAVVWLASFADGAQRSRAAIDGSTHRFQQELPTPSWLRLRMASAGLDIRHLHRHRHDKDVESVLAPPNVDARFTVKALARVTLGRLHSGPLSAWSSEA